MIVFLGHIAEMLLVNLAGAVKIRFREEIHRSVVGGNAYFWLNIALFDVNSERFMPNSEYFGRFSHFYRHVSASSGEYLDRLYSNSGLAPELPASSPQYPETAAEAY